MPVTGVSLQSSREDTISPRSVQQKQQQARLTPELMLFANLEESSRGEEASLGEDASESSTILPEQEGQEKKKPDELDQVKKVAKKETQRVQCGRFAIAMLLVIAGTVGTVATHQFLHHEQRRAFDTAFALFARTITNAALEQQRSIREGFVTLSETIGSVAQSSEATWPYFSMPMFETHAHNARIQSGAEMLTLGMVVTNEHRQSYTNWVNKNLRESVAEGHMIETGTTNDLEPVDYKPYIYKIGSDGEVPEDEHDYYIPLYGQSPPPRSYATGNFNERSVDDYAAIFDAIFLLKNETLFTRVRPHDDAISLSLTQEEHEAIHLGKEHIEAKHPHSMVFHPVHQDTMDHNSNVVAMIGGAVSWDAPLRNLLPAEVRGIFVVVQNSCNQAFTYQVQGRETRFVGEGDLHEQSFNKYKVSTDLALYTHPDFATTSGHCLFSMHIYPSSRFEGTYLDWTPTMFAAVVAFSFLVMGAGFYKYDLLVRKQNKKIVEDAATSKGLVSDMFPGKIRDRVLHKLDEATEVKGPGNLKAFMLAGDGEKAVDTKKSNTLADLFLDTSIAFADISGFTAWSSVREPTHVFTLLESLYSEFDEIAKRRRIFKVETVGDCYVAVAGLPDPMADHVVAIARFADEILRKTGEVTKKLEKSLGPDTGELTIKVGIHSGPVTGGVLSGDRSRFQLFGDTMNTASRMESTGVRGKIQVSKRTADLLTAAGKGSWLEPREDKVLAKGLGLLQTYWLNVNHKHRMGVSKETTNTTGSTGEASQHKDDQEQAMQPSGGLDEKTTRLVDWNVVILERLLRQIVARRNATSKKDLTQLPMESNPDGIPMDEVKEIIVLPEFDGSLAVKHKRWNSILLDEAVTQQLADYVTCIATLYHDNPFHSFDHCSHVVMSVVKLMSRIVAPPWTLDMETAESSSGQGKDKVAMTLHDHTYGITSDPLTQFACVFSALIHDVDHSGVPNTQLIKENPTLAALYKHRSVAEQNSLDIAWRLLMDDRFKDLRATIYSTPDELARFRQLVVNSVMASDIVDKDLKLLRNNRWDKAFAPEQDLRSDTSDELDHARATVNRKATIVIEHLIQASDVSHTMQHWHIYRKWNARLFEELYKAYVEGRAAKDPSEFWYEGEMGFFDFYVIPLARKLKDCGVFGKSSDEYLNYAVNNRQEWEDRGKEITAEMKELCFKKYISKEKETKED